MTQPITKAEHEITKDAAGDFHSVPPIIWERWLEEYAALVDILMPAFRHVLVCRGGTYTTEPGMTLYGQQTRWHPCGECESARKLIEDYDG